MIRSLPLAGMAAFLIGTSVLGAQNPTAGSDMSAISGVVMNGATRQPIPGATVTLAGATGQAVVSDPLGRFVFRFLPSGAYGLRAQKIGYFSGLFGRDTAQVGLQTSLLLSARRIVLEDNEWFADASVILWPHGAISGTVRDDRGEPVVGRYIRALGDARHGPQFVPVPGDSALGAAALTVTDDRGMYSLGPLPPGQYLVSALPFDSTELHAVPEAAVTYPLTYYPGVRHVADAEPVSLAGGEHRHGVDVHLRPAVVRRIVGHVSGPSEAWTNLQLRLVSTSDAIAGTTAQIGGAWIGADGSFAFPSVPPGDYELIASPWAQFDLPSVVPLYGGPRRIQPGTNRLEQPEPGDRSTYWARVHVNVADSDITDILVSLTRSASVGGRVVLDDAAEAAGVAMPRRVLVTPADGPSFVSLGLEVTNGTFRSEGGMVDRYVLAALGPGTVTRSVRSGEREYAGRPLDFSSGVDVTDVVVTLTAESVVRGMVRDRAGTAASRAGVAVFPVDSEDWARFSFGSTASGREHMRFELASTDGAYRIGGLGAGTYHVVAVTDAWLERWAGPAFLRAAAARGTPLTLDWHEQRELDLVLTDIPAQ